MHCQELQTIHYPEMVTNMKGIGDQKKSITRENGSMDETHYNYN